MQASLLTAEAGFSAVFFARSDYDDMARRKASGSMEATWRPSDAVYGASADTFVGNFPNHYGPPAGFNYEWGSTDPPIQVRASHTRCVPRPPFRICSWVCSLVFCINSFRCIVLASIRKYAVSGIVERLAKWIILVVVASDFSLTFRC